MIIVSELASNAFLHSGSPDMRLLLRNRQGSVEVEVADHGRWKDQRPHAAAHLKTDGRGLQITQAYTDDFTVHRSDSGTRAVANVVKPQASQAV
jgi:anti-sigma regulatory factor (Ser/Thr protein kinase)